MNSPVACLPDPIQNMKKRNPRLNKTKNKKKTVRIARSMAMPTDFARASTSAPAAYGAVAGTKTILPLQAGVGRQLIVQNYELVHQQVGSNSLFSAGGDVCNPGLSTSFPWLSGIAKQYSKFKWKFLRYIYVPNCSTTTAGSVFYMFSYDYLDSGPASLAQVAQSDDSSIGNAWFGGAISPELAFSPSLSTREAIYVDYNTKKATNNWYYVRTNQSGVSPSSGGTLGGTVPPGLSFTPGSYPDPEARPATIYYGADAVPGTGGIGNLFVSYICEFAEPVAPALNA
jgi:hypothetical protein